MSMEAEDYKNPDWDEFNKQWKHVHEWKSYCYEDLEGIWDTFTDIQKKTIAENLQDIADNEEWD